eukprot:TRINITY_DN67256_c1_g16_i1.p1 TRINITY_DN67256_c1_g16~~TRINITY_DN67256_c1_g16_i1.p1  ORF type:complete len:840 (-),score=87.61 TRINITY_DN67256_c1_g16_i1:304-2709(-)
MEINPMDADNTRGTQEVVGQLGSDMPPEGRSRWNNRVAFIFAAVGSAIGLGNFWRFPYLMYKYGGGTFLIPYLICLFVIGIPMLAIELSLGQRMQRGDVGAFARIHPKLRGVGFASVLASFFVVSYYSVIISWTGIFLVKSMFVSPLEWGNSGLAIPDTPGCLEAFANNTAEYHLYARVLKRNDMETCAEVGTEAGASSGIAGWVLLSSAVVWIFTAISVMKGVKTASYVVYVTMPLPFILLVILFVRAVTLDGSGDGIDAYLGKWDMSALSDPGIWADAAGQIFFSLSVCYGVMTSYGSYLDKDQPIVANVFIVALTNSTFSFFAGFAVFGVLGNLAHVRGVPVEEVTNAGIALAFVVYPSALEAMSGSAFWCFILFATLFMLGIDSAFSLVEAVTTVIGDTEMNGVSVKQRLQTRFGKPVGEPIITVSVCFAAWLVGILYCADIGFYWLDIVDHYINNYTVLIDGLLESVAVTWVWGYAADRYKVGASSSRWWAGTFFVAGCVWIIITASTAVALAPCVDTKWDLNTGNSTVSYECLPQAKDCSLGVETINDKQYFVAGLDVWAQCPSFADLTAGGTGNKTGSMLLLPSDSPAVAACVTKVGEVCYAGGDLAIGAVVFVFILVVGWCISWKKSHLTPKKWLAAIWFSGSDRMMNHILWVDRDRANNIAWGRGARISDFFGAIFEVAFGILWKYIIPPVLMFLLILVFKKDVQDPYGGYPPYMQVICWIMIALTLVVFGVFVFLPGQYSDDAHLDEHPVDDDNTNYYYAQQQQPAYDYNKDPNGSPLPPPLQQQQVVYAA